MPLHHLKREVIISVFMISFLIIAFYFVATNAGKKSEPIQILGRSDIIEAQTAGSSGGHVKYINQDNYTGIKISKEYNFDIDGDGLAENVLIKSYEIVTDRKNNFTYYGFVTDVLTKRSGEYVRILPQLYGYILDAKDVTLDQRNIDKILMVELKQGELDNFRIYRWRNDNLIRISTPDDESDLFYGIMTKGEVNFEDLNQDGIKEMVVYSRLQPPQKKREVDVYEISNLKASLVRTYEEETSKIY